MKVLLFISFILTSITLFSQQPLHRSSASLKSHISKNKSVGISGGYATSDRVLWIGHEGYSDLKAKKPIDSLTLFRTASIAKPITAIAIMQLYEEGILDIDRAVSEYISNFPIKEGSLITVRHLLQHSSGIGGYQSAKEAETKTEYPSLRDAIEVFQDRDLNFTPGSNYYYTTYGYVVLGWIIEEISGLPFELYVKKNIFEPLKMNNTGVEKYHSPNLRQTKFYTQKNTNTKKYSSSKNKIKEKKRTNLSNRIPGGGFYSTTHDLLKFGQAILKNRLVTKETLDLMLTDPKLRKEGNSYGMGWFLYGENPKYGNVFGHGGAQTGASNLLMILPDEDLVIVILSNTSHTGGHVFGMMLNFFEDAYKFKSK